MASLWVAMARWRWFFHLFPIKTRSITASLFGLVLLIGSAVVGFQVNLKWNSYLHIKEKVKIPTFLLYHPHLMWIPFIQIQDYTNKIIYPVNLLTTYFDQPIRVYFFLCPFQFLVTLFNLNPTLPVLNRN